MERPSPEKRLSTRLFSALFLMALFVVLGVTAAVVGISWTAYERDAESALMAQVSKNASELSGLSEEEMVTRLNLMTLAETRVTLVADDGRVLFDTHGTAESMANHGNREEIARARSDGNAITLRLSQTTGTDTLYAAAPVPGSGDVLRLSTTRASLASYLGGMMPALAIIMLLVVLLSLVMARIVTRRIAAPLVAIDPEHPLESDTYVEVAPQLDRIDAQKRKLVDQNRQLEQAVALRREFTGNVSHEMKSPLQVIGGYAELIENGIAEAEDVRRFAALIHGEAQSMRRLIDDVLTLSRLDETTQHEARPFDFGAVVARALDRLAPAAQGRGVHVSCSVFRVTEVLGSELLAEQVVYNLVDNAIRHGREDGMVEVCLAAHEKWAVLTVADDGEGIVPEVRDRVFERFYRVDASRSRETGGTGLGLAIVKHAAESMGGSAHVGDCALGGAMFTVMLPRAMKDDEKDGSAPAL